MTTYTVISRSSGEPEATGLSLADAADHILKTDGREYEIRPDPIEGGWVLWERQQVANIKWHPTLIGTFLNLSREEAEAKIFASVVADSKTWRGYPEAITDQEYAEMIERLRAEEEEADQ